MPPISAILHTLNDEARLGRALATLHPCDEIIVVDRGSTDGTLWVARQFGAVIRPSNPYDLPSAPLESVRNDWVLYLLPCEALTEGLEASLFEWKLSDARDVAGIPACSARIREQALRGWTNAAPSTRLVPKSWQHWDGLLPGHDPRSLLLQGELLRFRAP